MSFPNFITCFAVALLLVVATATATAIASPDSLPYLVSELLITGTIDEIPFDLTGTIQQVEVQYVKPAIAIPCFSECLVSILFPRYPEEKFTDFMIFQTGFSIPSIP
ncbi:uncharacterized protein L3040_001934 [Drepanopeziza brunnea f. sp. 'multigermtubi']|uniref:uncharacterized protein n=1 Tax=Drepanopeziza brunnea f. sp. 'multigermtubi' TaxID=698441 RepID=UPI002390A66E|nr:hypothetical protein L3040_001934 [Drepanopeziza brunnea f. sp. 'multigermtubi']